MAGGGFDAPESGSSGLHKQKKYKKGKKIGVRIDMTPMVDVIMLLLTFFILTTTLNTPQIMQINLPKGDESDKVKVDMGDVLYIRVSDKGNPYFSRGLSDGTEAPPEKVEFRDMKAKIEAIYAQNPKLLILLKFDRKMKYNMMVDVLDEINKAAIEKRYSFLKMEDADKEIVTKAGG
ncbi:MAG: biopolymer transporter ExbD [Ignavibacteria bacterium]|jgi:biopolymer transport protein ExbD|nr:biopolymer transporter ExbD [Ignavibacteria bacterium]MBK9227009.1 biopolymer transporter ExbD [Ignavibacteria bacterium]